MHFQSSDVCTSTTSGRCALAERRILATSLARSSRRAGRELRSSPPHAAGRTSKPCARKASARSSPSLGIGPRTSCGTGISIRTGSTPAPFAAETELKGTSPMRLPRLLMLLHDYYPEEVRVVAEARAAAAAGFEVDVIALRGADEPPA